MIASRRRFAPALGMIATLYGVGLLWPSLLHTLFVRPAAILASWMLPLQHQPVADGVALVGYAFDITVTRACAGTTFFVMLCGMACFALSDRPRYWPLIPLASWLITCVANTARIVLSVFAHHTGLALLPPTFAGAIHQTSGILIFLPTLILTHYLLTRRATA